MEAPKCKLCGIKHLLSEPHVFKTTDKCRLCGHKHELNEPHVYKDNRPKDKAMPTAAEINHTWETRKHCKTCRCFPMTAAERQKAYRERHKAKQ